MAGINDITKGVGSSFKQGMNGSPLIGFVALIFIAAYAIQKFTGLPLFDWLMTLLDWIGTILWKLFGLIIDLFAAIVNALTK